MENFFKGPGQTTLADNELLLEVEIPPPPANSAGCYLRLTPREEMDIGVVGVASFVVLEGQNICQEVRITLGAVAPTPIRAPEAEAVLKGRALSDEAIEEAAEKAAEAASPISDVRGSAEYRTNIAKVLSRRTLKRAWESASNQA